jgi:hypothetical protein
VYPLAKVFQSHEDGISTQQLDKGLTSDQVLAILRKDLQELGFEVEAGKMKEERKFETLGRSPQRFGCRDQVNGA